MLDSVAYFIVDTGYVVRLMSLFYAKRCSIISNNYTKNNNPSSSNPPQSRQTLHFPSLVR